MEGRYINFYKSSDEASYLQLCEVKVYEGSSEKFSQKPTETVTVQPDGSIQHDIDCSNLGDPLRTPIPSLTAEDLEFLDEFTWATR
ncbi:unnamed protein product [Arctogadus glacialis]